jgi:hypothetical protein
MQPYYAVVGNDGVVVVNDIKKANREMAYLTGHRWMKRFNSFAEATEYALNHLAKCTPGKRQPMDLPLNFIVYTSALDDLIKPFTIRKLADV